MARRNTLCREGGLSFRDLPTSTKDHAAMTDFYRETSTSSSLMDDSINLGNWYQRYALERSTISASSSENVSTHLGNWYARHVLRTSRLNACVGARQ